MTRDIWSNHQAEQWAKKHSSSIGVNFLPKTAINSTEMWQADSFDAETIQNELEAAAEIGITSLRVFIQYLVWKEDKIGFHQRFQSFLKIADCFGMTVMPVVFDDCSFGEKEPYLGKQNDPVPFVQNSGWTPSPGFQAADCSSERARLEAYVKDMIERYGNDQRILIWDLYNEAGNSGRGAKSADLLKFSFKWAREAHPMQPLTACLWSWEYITEAEKAALSLSDVISFHSYENLDKIKRQVEQSKEYGRPLICTEWLHRPSKSLVQTHLPFFMAEGISCYHWGLFNGKSQTHLGWDTCQNWAGERPGIDKDPSVWQHDLFYKDGTPYDSSEIACFQNYKKNK